MEDRRQKKVSPFWHSDVSGLLFVLFYPVVIAVLAWMLTGCLSYTSNGDGFGTSSPDDKFSLAVEIDGADGHRYLDKTKKKIWIRFLTGSGVNYKPLCHYSYTLTGSDIEWKTHWSSPEAASVEFYDWGNEPSNYHDIKHVGTSNHIALLSFILDKSTGKFIEKR